MTGTAMTEAEEFYDIYKLNVVSIPTNKKMQRKDYNDQIFRTEPEKYSAITNKIIECNNKGQPVLVGTTSVVYIIKFKQVNILYIELRLFECSLECFFS